MKMAGCLGGILLMGFHISKKGGSEPLTFIMTKMLQGLIQWLNLSSKHNFNGLASCALIKTVGAKGENQQCVNEAKCSREIAEFII